MVQLVHGGQDAEGVAHVQDPDLLAVAHDHFDAAVYEHRPRVQLLAVVDDEGAGLVNHREHHHGAELASDGQRHVGEGGQVLGELQEGLDVVLRTFGRVFFEAVAHPVSDCQALEKYGCILSISVNYCQNSVDLAIFFTLVSIITEK